MTIEEICDKHGVQVAYFDKELWHRHGVYIDEIKIVFVNKALKPFWYRICHQPD